MHGQYHDAVTSKLYEQKGSQTDVKAASSTQIKHSDNGASYGIVGGYTTNSNGPYGSSQGNFDISR